QPGRVIAPAHVQRARVIAEVLAKPERRTVQHIKLLRRQHRPPADLPGVTTLEAGVVQDASLVELGVEVVRHEVTLKSDRIDAHALHELDLVGNVTRRIVQEEVGRESAAANDERLTVDQELAHSSGCIRPSTDEAARNRADTELL